MPTLLHTFSFSFSTYDDDTGIKTIHERIFEYLNITEFDQVPLFDSSIDNRNTKVGLLQLNLYLSENSEFLWRDLDIYAFAMFSHAGR